MNAKVHEQAKRELELRMAKLMKEKDSVGERIQFSKTLADQQKQVS